MGISVPSAWVSLYKQFVQHALTSVLGFEGHFPPFQLLGFPTSEGGNVTDVTFVDDCIVEVAVAEVRTYADEYDTNLENNFYDREDEDITPITVSRSGRQIRAHFRLDFLGTLTVDISNNLMEK